MAPVLVLQMQRLGDLILSFPLLNLLHQRFPDQEPWVVAEPAFFRPLIRLAPPAVFFPADQCEGIAVSQPYALGINLSTRPAAARGLAAMQTPQRLGPALSGDRFHVYGFWQLYRQALTQNNRGNPFHWSDLNLLDLVPDADIHQNGYSLPRPARTGRVGLVLGASERAKRPPASFWARLARRLAAEGRMPLFLGGEAERDLGRETARLSGLPQANFCGRLPLDALVAVMRRLDLCITPDTGPMHLANWLGVPVLNLSLGPVHARETGPSAPGQWILRASLSCTGCWQCRNGALHCHSAFSPHAVARIAGNIIRYGDALQFHADDLPPGLELFRTERNDLGLHQLRPVGERRQSVRPLLETFWQTFFLALCQPALAAQLPAAEAPLAEQAPHLHQRLRRGLQHIHAACARHTVGKSSLPVNYWRAHPPLLRLVAGFCQMWLDNHHDARPQQEYLLHALERVLQYR